MKFWHLLAGLALVGLSRRVSASPSSELGPVVGDLERNWGKTPANIRRLLLRAEAASGLTGAARFLAVASWRESRWKPDAHNDSDGEVAASRSAWESLKGKRPPLAWGEEAADFGSGGLFGLLAPYFLWTGVPEVGEDAPLLDLPPTSVFDPAVSAFAAAVYMQRVIANYQVEDWADVRAGWASPSLLTAGRGGAKHLEVRARFANDALTVGIDLADTTTIPTKPSAAAWPGVLAVYAALVPVNS